MNIGERIHDLRKKRHLSQMELGNESGVAQAYLGQVERGMKSPTLRTIEKLAKVLDVTLAEFFEYPVPVDASKERAILELQAQLKGLSMKELHLVSLIVRELK